MISKRIKRLISSYTPRVDHIEPEWYIVNTNKLLQMKKQVLEIPGFMYQ